MDYSSLSTNELKQQYRYCKEEAREIGRAFVSFEGLAWVLTASLLFVSAQIVPHNKHGLVMPSTPIEFLALISLFVGGFALLIVVANLILGVYYGIQRDNLKESLVGRLLEEEVTFND